MRNGIAGAVLAVACLVGFGASVRTAHAQASFYYEECDDHQVDLLVQYVNQALALVEPQKSVAQFERWFGTYNSDVVMRLDYVRQFILESLQIADLGAAARHVLGLDLTGAFPVRFRCNGYSMANLAHKGGDDLIILDIPFWDRTDAELSSFQTHAGTIIHEITHLNGVGHLPGCNVMSECFTLGLEYAARNEITETLDSAHNYEYYFGNK